MKLNGKKLDHTTRMVEAPILPLVLRMSGPTVLSMLVMSLYTIVDALFISAISEEALRAVSIVYPVFHLMFAVGVGTSVGVNSFLARSLGAGDNKSADEAASHSFVLSFCNWFMFLLIGYFAAPFIANIFTEHASVARDSVSYMRILMMGSLGLFWQIHGEKIFQATGNMVRAMASQLMGALINIALDPILIHGWLGFPALGVNGAAIATVIAQFIGGFVVLYWLFIKKRVVTIRLRGFRFRKKVLKEIYRVGFPTIIMMSVMSFVGLAFNAIIRPFSEMAITVFGIYLKIESFVFMPVFGISQGILPIMAYNYGAKRYDRIRKVLKTGLLLTFGIMFISTVLFLAFPKSFLQAFNATEEMLVMGIPALRSIALCFVFAGVTIMLSQAFQALGRGVYSLIVSVFRQVVLLLPLARLFAIWHLDLVWYAYLISDVGAMILAIIIFRNLSKKAMPMEECSDCV